MAGNGNERDNFKAAPDRGQNTPWLQRPAAAGRLETEPIWQDPNEQAPPPDVHVDPATRQPRREQEGRRSRDPE